MMTQNASHHHNTRNHGAITNGAHTSHNQAQNSDRRDGHRNKRTYGDRDRNGAYDNGGAVNIKRQRTDNGKNGSHSMMGVSTTTASG